MTRQAEVIRHPIDPIGGSDSTSIQVFFLLIVLTVGALVLDLIAWLWLETELRAQDGDGTRHPGSERDACARVS